MNKALLVAVIAVFAPTASAFAQTVDSSVIERIARADTNGDSVVTRSEFLTFRNAQFPRIDRNRDGYLSRTDAPRFGAALVNIDVASMVEQFDANDDGLVSRAELASGPTPAFDVADRNRDDVVTQAERQAAAAAARR